MLLEVRSGTITPALRSPLTWCNDAIARPHQCRSLNAVLLPQLHGSQHVGRIWSRCQRGVLCGTRYQLCTLFDSQIEAMNEASTRSAALISLELREKGFTITAVVTWRTVRSPTGYRQMPSYSHYTSISTAHLFSNQPSGELGDHQQ